LPHTRHVTPPHSMARPHTMPRLVGLATAQHGLFGFIAAYEASPQRPPRKDRNFHPRQRAPGWSGWRMRASKPRRTVSFAFFYFTDARRLVGPLPLNMVFNFLSSFFF
jgi:hypothetical protein